MPPFDIDEDGVLIDIEEGEDLDMEKKLFDSINRWTSADKINYFMSTNTYDKLTPGLYNISFSQQHGLYFQKNDVDLKDLIKFPGTKIGDVVDECKKFWDSKDLYVKAGLKYRRGYLFYGPGGVGKSSHLNLIIDAIIKQGGIAFSARPNISLFSDGLKLFRKIEPNTPIVCTMEDIDGLLAADNKSAILNLLDGTDSVDNCIFLATTNYINSIEPRIKNRPSRFDRRILVDYPNKNIRAVYAKHVIDKLGVSFDIPKVVADTNGLSVAHIKELILRVVVYQDKYDVVLKELLDMRKNTTAADEEEGMKNDKVGF